MQPDRLVSGVLVPCAHVYIFSLSRYIHTMYGCTGPLSIFRGPCNLSAINSSRLIPVCSAKIRGRVTIVDFTVNLQILPRKPGVKLIHGVHTSHIATLKQPLVLLARIVLSVGERLREKDVRNVSHIHICESLARVYICMYLLINSIQERKD